MTPQELLEKLRRMQMVVNNITISSAAASYALGAYVEFLGGAEDLARVSEYTDKVVDSTKQLSHALEQYFEAAMQFGGGRP